jgi:hypothetical protein
MFDMGAVLNVSGFSKKPINAVVNTDPTRVLTAMLFPRIQNARTISKILIPLRIIPGENGRKRVRITEIPLVPPSKSE